MLENEKVSIIVLKIGNITQIK